MANDGIRLASDSALASQKIVRAGGQPETIAPPAKNAPPAPVTPLLTIVLQSNALIEGRQAALYELILQNDPKSGPPLRLLSDAPIKPGTSLLLELDKNQQYQPVQQPTLSQLTKLVNLELDFWRGHLLPKAAAHNFPLLPPQTALTGLADRFNALTPLVNWLNQRPNNLSSLVVNAWMRETVALTQLRPWADTPMASASSPTDSANTPGLTARPLTPTKIQVANYAWQVLSLPRLGQVGSVNAALISTLAPIAGPTGSTLSQTVGAGIIATPGSTPAPIAGPTGSTLSQTVGAGMPVGAGMTVGAGIIATPGSTPAPIAGPTGSTLSQTVGAGMPVGAGMIAAPGTANTEPSILTAKQGPTLPISQHSNLVSPLSAGPTSGSGHQEAPLEIKLGQWLGVLDETIKASPIQLNARLKQQASELLQQALLQPGKIRAQLDPSQNKTSDKDDSPLLALRNWLEASQARIQNSAVQTASAQWSAPDQTPVQQMQLPLIWLGLTSWADIEWWQEKHLSTRNADKDARARRRWRMKVYLSLAPMANVCADIDWGSDVTNLIFWCEDAATLSHLNGLLPKLENWTAGLGERNLQTKHGMPKKMNADREKEKDNHLVDLHT